MKRFKLVWSPEGKTIDIVHAETAEAAKRLTPLPWKKFLGEVYAEEAPAMRQVTANQWADHCASLRCFGSELNKDTMIHRLILGFDKNNNIIPGMVVGKVDYSTDPQTYWIDTGAPA